MSLDDSLEEERASILNALVAKCVAILQKPDVLANHVKAVVGLLHQILTESERKGLDVQPHSCLRKGESLERVIIQNKTRPHAPSVIVRCFTNTTIWEFADKISRLVDLAP